MSRPPRTGLALLAVALITGPARPDDNLPVPADSLVVLQVNGTGRFKQKVLTLIDEVAPDRAAEVKRRVEAEFRDFVTGRDLTGLAPDGRAFAYLTSVEAGRGEMPYGFVAPAADYTAFRDKLFTADERRSFQKGQDGIDTLDVSDRPVYLIDRTPQGHVHVTPNRELAERLRKTFPPLTADILGGASDAFLGSDVSLFLNFDRLNELYPGLVKQLRPFVAGLFRPGGTIPGLDVRQLDQAKAVIDGLFQVVEDGKGVALGLTVGPDGAGARGVVTFKPDSTAGKLLAGEAPTPLAKLGELPAGQALYTASRFGPEVMAIARKLNREFVAADGDDRSAANIDRLAGLMAGGKVSAGGIGDGGPSVTVFEPPDPAKLVEAQLKVYRSLGDGASYLNVRLKGRPSVQEGDQKFQGFTLHRAGLALDFEATAANVPDANLREATVQSMKRLVAEKPTVWFGTDGRRYVQVGGKDWDAARTLLADHLAGNNPVARDEAFNRTRGQLPAEATMIAVADSARAVSTFGRYAKGVMDALPGFPGADLPEFAPPPDAPPAYIGVALVLKPASAEFAVAVPVAAMKAARKVIRTDK